ncbi:MAG: DNA ligase D, partial [Calditrichia bacterium]
HPSFKGLREDKKPRQVVRENPEQSGDSGNGAGEPAAEKKKNSRRRAADNNGGGSFAGITLSNPDKVLYPEMGLTKMQLAEYYEKVAGWILPHVEKRPLTLVRCPSGHNKNCFYQKHLNETVPDAIHSVKIKEKEDEENPYMYIDDAAGLITLVQMGVLEIHPWGSRVDKLEKPDIMIFDLDPDKGMEWGRVVNAARTLRETLDSLGLQSFLKTSGGKGLHLVVPLQRRTDWDDTKSFARAVAEFHTRKSPEEFIATMSKAKRKGKIFIDYLRNGRGATSVAPYSTRARSGAPVSAPIRWDELSESLKPGSYTVENLPRRLAQLKEDPWVGFFDVRQSITKKMMKELQS